MMSVVIYAVTGLLVTIVVALMAGRVGEQRRIRLAAKELEHSHHRFEKLLDLLSKAIRTSDEGHAIEGVGRTTLAVDDVGAYPFLCAYRREPKRHDIYRFTPFNADLSHLVYGHGTAVRAYWAPNTHIESKRCYYDLVWDEEDRARDAVYPNELSVA